MTMKAKTYGINFWVATPFTITCVFVTISIEVPSTIEIGSWSSSPPFALFSKNVADGVLLPPNFLGDHAMETWKNNTHYYLLGMDVWFQFWNPTRVEDPCLVHSQSAPIGIQTIGSKNCYSFFEKYPIRCHFCGNLKHFVGDRQSFFPHKTLSNGPKACIIDNNIA